MKVGIGFWWPCLFNTPVITVYSTALMNAMFGGAGGSMNIMSIRDRCFLIMLLWSEYTCAITLMARRKGSQDCALMIEPDTIAVELKKYMSWMQEPKVAARSSAIRGYMWAHFMSAGAMLMPAWGKKHTCYKYGWYIWYLLS